MKQAISETVDKWLKEETQPRVRRLTAVRKNSPWYGMSDEEIEDRREFIRYYLNKDFELLLLIPDKPRANDFWFASQEEFRDSPFNTWDYEKKYGAFDKHGYRVKKVLEHVKDLALLHSCISQPEGRKNTLNRFEVVIKEEFRNPLLEVIEGYRKTFNEERRAQLRSKIAKISQHILECKMVWEKFSLWEDSSTCYVPISLVQDCQTSPPR